MMEIGKELDRLLKQVEKPARYIGGEINAVQKTPEDVRLRFGFAFPDTYEIGMSYMGLQLLYSILNRDEEIYCERVFAPAMDMEALMAKGEHAVVYPGNRDSGKRSGLSGIYPAV